jgi:lactose/L-arabinose transport system ATP-binding protein
MTLADRIVVLRAGAVEQVGSPAALYADPANMFVAGFIGSPRMNFLRAEATGTGAVRLPDFGGAAIPVSVPLAPGREVRLGLRPEHFRAGGPVALAVPVDMVENLGTTAYAYRRTGGEGGLTVELADPAAAREGAVMEARFDPARALLFDPASGARLR